jgi:hypothetical protein
MKWRMGILIAVAGLAVVLLAMFYSGMFMHGD